jgi:hypothetical protein
MNDQGKNYWKPLEGLLHDSEVEYGHYDQNQLRLILGFGAVFRNHPVTHQSLTDWIVEIHAVGVRALAICDYTEEAEQRKKAIADPIDSDNIDEFFSSGSEFLFVDDLKELLCGADLYWPSGSARSPHMHWLLGSELDASNQAIIFQLRKDIEYDLSALVACENLEAWEGGLPFPLDTWRKQCRTYWEDLRRQDNTPGTSRPSD